MTNGKSGEVSPHFESVSAHFQLFSQNKMQHEQQYENGREQDHGVESEYTKRDSEITFLQTEEHVRLTAAPVIGLLHLGSRDQVRHFLVHVKLICRDRALCVFEQRAIEPLLSRNNWIELLQIPVDIPSRRSFQSGE